MKSDDSTGTQHRGVDGAYHDQSELSFLESKLDGKKDRFAAAISAGEEYLAARSTADSATKLNSYPSSKCGKPKPPSKRRRCGASPVTQRPSDRVPWGEWGNTSSGDGQAGLRFGDSGARGQASGYDFRDNGLESGNDFYGTSEISHSEYVKPANVLRQTFWTDTMRRSLSSEKAVSVRSLSVAEGHEEVGGVRRGCREDVYSELKSTVDDVVDVTNRLSKCGASWPAAMPPLKCQGTEGVNDRNLTATGDMSRASKHPLVAQKCRNNVFDVGKALQNHGFLEKGDECRQIGPKNTNTTVTSEWNLKFKNGTCKVNLSEDDKPTGLSPWVRMDGKSSFAQGPSNDARMPRNGQDNETHLGDGCTGKGSVCFGREYSKERLPRESEKSMRMREKQVESLCGFSDGHQAEDFRPSDDETSRGKKMEGLSGTSVPALPESIFSTKDGQLDQTWLMQRLDAVDWEAISGDLAVALINRIPRVRGVCFDRKGLYWISQWHSRQKKHREWFAVKRLGFEKAWKLAVCVRRDAEKVEEEAAVYPYIQDLEEVGGVTYQRGMNGRCWVAYFLSESGAHSALEAALTEAEATADSVSEGGGCRGCSDPSSCVLCGWRAKIASLKVWCTQMGNGPCIGARFFPISEHGLEAGRAKAVAFVRQHPLPEFLFYVPDGKSSHYSSDQSCIQADLRGISERVVSDISEANADRKAGEEDKSFHNRVGGRHRNGSRWSNVFASMAQSPCSLSQLVALEQRLEVILKVKCAGASEFCYGRKVPVCRDGSSTGHEMSVCSASELNRAGDDTAKEVCEALGRRECMIRKVSGDMSTLVSTNRSPQATRNVMEIVDQAFMTEKSEMSVKGFNKRKDIAKYNGGKLGDESFLPTGQRKGEEREVDQSVFDDDDLEAARELFGDPSDGKEGNAGLLKLPKIGGVYYKKDGNYKAWAASWHIKGKRVRRYFTVKKHGFKNAYIQAVQARREAEKQEGICVKQRLSGCTSHTTAMDSAPKNRRMPKKNNAVQAKNVNALLQDRTPKESSDFIINDECVTDGNSRFADGLVAYSQYSISDNKLDSKTLNAATSSEQNDIHLDRCVGHVRLHESALSNVNMVGLENNFWFLSEEKLNTSEVNWATASPIERAAVGAGLSVKDLVTMLSAENVEIPSNVQVAAAREAVIFLILDFHRHIRCLMGFDEDGVELCWRVGDGIIPTEDHANALLHLFVLSRCLCSLRETSSIMELHELLGLLEPCFKSGLLPSQLPLSYSRYLLHRVCNSSLPWMGEIDYLPDDLLLETLHLASVDTQEVDPVKETTLTDVCMSIREGIDDIAASETRSDTQSGTEISTSFTDYVSASTKRKGENIDCSRGKYGKAADCVAATEQKKVRSFNTSTGESILHARTNEVYDQCDLTSNAVNQRDIRSGSCIMFNANAAGLPSISTPRACDDSLGRSASLTCLSSSHKLECVNDEVGNRNIGNATVREKTEVGSALA